MEVEAPVSLVDLPDPCLLAVLRCLSDDPVSLFSAARVHSRLHQAAVVALSSITLTLKQQQQMDSVLLYLQQHGKQLGSVQLTASPSGPCRTITLRQLPANLQLTSLLFDTMHLQLQPGHGFQGVLRAGLPLKQLRLQQCTFLDGARACEAAWQALLLLPGLEDLSFTCQGRLGWVCPPSTVLAQLQRLTCLELGAIGARDMFTYLQHLQGLTRLVALKVTCWGAFSVTASVILQLRQLTRLELLGPDVLEPAALSGKVQLQRLTVRCTGAFGGAAELLSQLQHLTQLTYLNMGDSFHGIARNDAPQNAAAFSALTASSKLQHLNISSCLLLADVWQHVFPTGRRLPHLHSLLMEGCRSPRSEAGLPSKPATAPEGSRLVSCCPGLQHLDMRWLQYNADVLGPLLGLSSLRTVLLSPVNVTKGLEVVGQLPQLRHLVLHASGVDAPKGLLLHVTHLKQLTYLDYDGILNRQYTVLKLEQQAPGDESIWRQVLRLHLDHHDTEVAQQAAAALAD